MDTYPNDLVVGVSPLIHVVDAILENENNYYQEDEQDISSLAAGSGADKGVLMTEEKIDPDEAEKRKNTTLFGKFLNVLSKSFSEINDSSTGNDDSVLPTTTTTTTTTATSSSVSSNTARESNSTLQFLNEEYDTSDDEDDENDADDNDYYGASATTAANSSTGKTRRLHFPGSNRLKQLGGQQRGQQQQQETGSSEGKDLPLSSFSFAKTDKQFFHNARIMPIAKTHGFPPSKDEHCTSNRIMLLSEARSSATPSTITPLPPPGSSKLGRNSLTKRRISGDPYAAQYQQILCNEQPIDGIVPEGWLEKHVYALPSVLLVVSTLSLSSSSSSVDQQQQQQLQNLYNAIEHLQYSLASKRQCHIHVIILLREDSNSTLQQIQIDNKVLEIHNKLLNSYNINNCNITVLNIRSDVIRQFNNDTNANDTLQQQLSVSNNMYKLYHTIRNESYKYYLRLSRRSKRKLQLLEHQVCNYLYKPSSQNNNATLLSSVYNGKIHHNLLPLAIKYCFKIAIYYEFQLRLDRSTKFFSMSYRYLSTYYQILAIQQQLKSALPDGSKNNDEQRKEQITELTHVNIRGDDNNNGNGGEEGIEMGLASSTNTSASNLSQMYADDTTAGTATTDDFTEQESFSTTRGAASMIDNTGVSSGTYIDNNSNNTASTVVSIPLSAYDVLSNIEPPLDMEEQCRTISGWINFKLLKTGLSSVSCIKKNGTTKGEDGNDSSNSSNPAVTVDGLIAASIQYRKHCQIFLYRNTNNNPKWNHWRYVTQQQLIMSQLLEQYNPLSAITSTTPILFSFSSEINDDVLRNEISYACNIWKNYISVIESTLRLGLEVSKETARINDDTTTSITSEGITTISTPSSSPTNSSKKKKKSFGKPYIGGVDSDGLEVQLRKEIQFVNNNDHYYREKALALARCAIKHFEEAEKIAITEEEMEDDGTAVDEDGQKNDFDDDAGIGNKVMIGRNLRSSARLYYLAGGILLGMKRHQEATIFLEKAVRYVVGWDELEHTIRKLLLECYESATSTNTLLTGDTNESTKQKQNMNVTNMVLSSFFNMEMSKKNLRRTLALLCSSDDQNKNRSSLLKWNHVWVGESDQGLPFTFVVTFPESTHSTAGDIVRACITIKSNLDYAVHVKSVTLLSMAGNILVPSKDLLCAKNANDGGENSIIIQGQSVVYITTLINIPKDVDSIKSDDSGNGGETKGTPGKGSFSKSARPRSAGLTAAGGSRLISENGSDREKREGNAQWSLAYLGGKPLRCDGMSLIFLPVHVERAVASGTVSFANSIEATIIHKKPKTNAPFKRTPFEEDNYISSAWLRPSYLPLSLGPRCLRVLAPMAQMVVTNVTNPLTKDKAMDGTVNRILLKLQAGPKEECKNIRFRVTCSNTLLATDGTTTNLDEAADTSDSENEESETFRKHARRPLLVREKTDDGSPESDAGQNDYELPPGWMVLGSGRGTHDELIPTYPNIKAGECTYIYFDIYRPCSSAESADTNHNLCQTDFDVAISYRQARVPKKNLEKSTESEASQRDDLSDLVFLEYSGSVVWSAPLSASFSVVGGVQKAYPSGCRHPSNLCPVESSQGQAPKPETQSTEASEVLLVDGERVNTRCTLKSDSAADGLAANIVKVSYEEPDLRTNEGDDRPCNIRLASDCSEGLLYQQGPGDVSSRLSEGSVFNINYVTEVNMLSHRKHGSVSAVLGMINVEWKPIELEPVISPVSNDPIQHGPLVLKSRSVMKFCGPPCYIENAPFETVLEALPASPQLAVPFALRYRITNKTNLHQTLSVVVNEVPPSDNGSGIGGDDDEANSSILLTGLVNGEIRLAPHETHHLAYTALATKVGIATMPILSVSSARDKTWVINDNAASARRVVVLP